MAFCQTTGSANAAGFFKEESTSMSRYRWVYHNEAKLYDVGILPDGTLHNPRGYPDDDVRSAQP